ncbi:MAG: recombinase RecT [Acidaminobacter sp.]|uniref:recombinase RecT n=1 Tax=Acidaminobacter sp. TaxID=1872102 RepID=UPI001382CE49|nr:recombinase RecT [Acidaminobacter sp.]MZQ97177.1 recombinase RecT [Acidaminobacter sp.]
MNNLQIVKQYLFANKGISSRIEAMLGDKAEGFKNSIINVMSNNALLEKANPDSIIRSAMVAASLDLPIDPNLGFAAIVPYKGEAQFQMMYRGFVQLAIRSGQYKNINATEIYEDELVSWDPFKARIKLQSGTDRNQGGKVVGYYAYFELLNGFEKELYMTADEMEKHANQYSASYKNDKAKGYKGSKWTTDFDAMGKKTVLKLLISKYGIMSLQMQQAQTFDQAILRGDVNDPKPEYIDNPDFKDTTIETNPFEKKEATDVDYQEVDLAGTPFDAEFK